MRKTLVKKPKKLLSPKQREFIAEYMVDYDGERAARAIGTPRDKAKGVAGRFLKEPLVMKVIDRVSEEQTKKLTLKRNEILNHLAACALRNGKMFVDKQGRLLLTNGNIRDLPDEVTCAIDSIKQKRKTYVNEDGDQVEVLETELKLVSKLGALEAAMRHKGMFPSEKVDHNVHGAVVTINWADMLKATNPMDSIEEEIIRTEQRLLGVDRVDTSLPFTTVDMTSK